MKLPSFLRGNNRSRGFPRNADRRSRTSTVLVTLVLVFCGIFLSGMRLLTPGFFMTAATPLLQLGNKLTASVASAGRSGTSGASGSSLQEIDDLRTQNDSLRNEDALLSGRINELTTLLGTSQVPAKGIIAGVLARPPVSPYDVLMLDQGTSAGVKVDAQVTAMGGIPIGKITGITSNSSRVTLYSLTGATTQGWIGSNKLPVTFVGDGSGAFSTTVPKGAAIAVGDGAYVVAGGSQPIGVVIAVESDASSPNEQVHIRPYVNPFSLTAVLVGR